MLRFEDIRFDCALYNGYKPCRHGNECADCPHYEPMQPPDQRSGFVTVPRMGVRKGGFEIIIIKTGAMGDVLRTTTLLPALAREHGNARVTWVTDRSALPLLADNPFIAELLEFGPATAGALASREFDLLLCFEKDREALELASRLSAHRKRGFGPTPWGTPTVLNPESRYGLLLGLSDELKFRVNRQTYPEIIAGMACVEYRRDPYVLEIGEAGRRRRAAIEAMLPPGRRPRIGINTGCGAVFRTKQWTLEGWVELVDFIRAHGDCDLLLLGGTAEEDLNREIAARTRGLIDTGTGNSLAEFIGVVDACDLVVSSDSLAMHIATALRKWVVAIFGSTSPVEVDLFDRGEKVVTDFECSPCYLKTCDKNPTCMQALRGSTVGEAVVRGLAEITKTKSA